MAEVVGIDLGTSNTVVAHADGRSARALRDEGVYPLIPSIVSFHPSGSVLVGRGAKERRIIDSKNDPGLLDAPAHGGRGLEDGTRTGGVFFSTDWGDVASLPNRLTR